MADRDELVSIPMKRADAEALSIAAAFGLAVNDGLARVTSPATAERGLAELERALGRRGATVTATMSRLEAEVLARMADDGLRVWSAALRTRLAPESPPLLHVDRLDVEAARRGLAALQSRG